VKPGDIVLIERFVAETMSQVPPEFALAHDFKHVDRVRCWATLIASAEGVADLELVEATALLHDVGLAYVQDRKDHAIVGAKVAAEYLQAHNLFTAEEALSIAKAIRCHTLLQGGGKLGQILRDADILDLLGAVGIMRAFTSKHMKPEYDPYDVKGPTWGMTADDFTRRFHNGVGAGPTIIDQINFQISCCDNW
jgi:putative nucleotidyltransferase with HDIG domain